jgi:hypothetical protein
MNANHHKRALRKTGPVLGLSALAIAAGVTFMPTSVAGAEPAPPPKSTATQTATPIPTPSKCGLMHTCDIAYNNFDKYIRG